MNSAKITAPMMYLWRPDPVVTIGRHQNPWKECKLSDLQADGIQLNRRRSGGGCVWQDPGCSVFTFISPSDQFNIDKNLDIVLGALRRCGITGEKKGRNDMTFEGKKISGSAFRHVPDRKVSLHHGTILVNTAMTELQKYLTPDKRKLQAKGIASVGARVMNLVEQFPDFDHERLCDALEKEFREVHGLTLEGTPLEVIHADAPLTKEPGFQAVFDELNSDDWRLGRTPDFSHKMETRIDGIGVLDVQLNVVHGKIEDAVIFSDALFPEVISEATEVLKGVDYGGKTIRRALVSLQPHFTETGPRALLEALTNWLVAEVED